MKYHESRSYLVNYKCKFLIFIIITVTFLIIFLKIITFKSEEITPYKALVKCTDECILEIVSNDINSIKNGNKVVVNDKEYNYEIKELSEVIRDNTSLIEYQIVTLKVNDLNLINNDVINIKILGRRVLMISKIIELK